MTGRNESCPCGSGKKFKLCCGSSAAHNRQRNWLLQGVGLHQQGRLEEAEACYRTLLEQQPDHPDAEHYLGLIAFQRGQYMEAERHIRRALDRQIDPGMRSAYQCNLGNVYKRLGWVEQAENAYSAALSGNGRFFEAWYNRGLLWQTQDNHALARDYLERAHQLAPDHAEALFSLSWSEWQLADLDAAFRHTQRVLELAPGHVAAHQNFTTLLMRLGDGEAGLEHALRAYELAPDRTDLAGAVLMASLYQPHQPEELLELHRSFTARHYAPIVSLPVVAARTRGRLRIGYLSPDFRRHALRFFIRSLLRHHDRSQFEVCCYHTPAGPEDAITDELRLLPERWLPVGHLDDEALAHKIRGDGIDILIDLAGHTQGGRLGVFARQPAPCQLTMLGYVGPVALPQIAWRMSDRVACPATQATWFDEQILRMPEPYSQWCYSPDHDTPPPAPVAPCQANGYITFGAFHQSSKINEEVAGVWGRLLERLPTARLRLIVWGEEGEALMRARLARAGVDLERVICLPLASHDDYFAYYHHVDIALDVWPYTGGTVTCDALYMGVPTVTLAADSPSGRGGASLLTALGHPEWIAFTAEGYIDRAVDLASDFAVLTMLRQTLRAQMQKSPLMDEQGYVQVFEQVLTTLAGRSEL